jgi:thiol-disulfide isomerase/thioredoxin
VRRRILLLAAAILFHLAVYGQVYDHANEAFDDAEQSGRVVLLVFAGSDWCAPCIRFDKNILAQQKFLDYAERELVVLRADFPQRNKLSVELRMRNDSLAEQYNPNGLFPHLVLIRPDRSVLATLTYDDEPVDVFLSELDFHLKHEPATRIQKTN